MKSDAEAAEAFSQYLKFWMVERGISNATEVVDRAARKGAVISYTKVNSILLAQYANHQMRVLEAIALAIVRPCEEVFMAALGYYPALSELPEFKESDAAQLWLLYSKAPSAERKIYKRLIQMLANDIQRTTHKGDE